MAMKPLLNNGLCSKLPFKIEFDFKVFPTVCLDVLAHTLHREISSLERQEELLKNVVCYKRDLPHYSLTMSPDQNRLQAAQVFQLLNS